MRRFLAGLTLCVSLAAWPQERPPGTIEIRAGGRIVASSSRADGSLRVLFIGNSLTFWNELPWMTRRLASSVGAQPPLVTVFNGQSGVTLRQHWDRGRALRIIREQRWDFVVLQAQSGEILRTPGETASYATKFDEEIRKRGAKTVIFMTWIPLDMTTQQSGRRSSTAARFRPSSKGGFTQDELNARYLKLGRTLGAVVAPVGPAWQALERDGYELYDPGGVHPSLLGSYVAACVFYATFYEKSPQGATHTFDTKFDVPESYRHDLENEHIDSATASVIQRAAWQAVSARQ